MDVPNLLTVNAKAVEKAYANAVRAALLKHRQTNNPIAVWRQGKVVVLQAENVVTEKIDS